MHLYSPLFCVSFAPPQHFPVFCTLQAVAMDTHMPNHRVLSTSRPLWPKSMAKMLWVLLLPQPLAPHVSKSSFRNTWQRVHQFWCNWKIVFRDQIEWLHLLARWHPRWPRSRYCGVIPRATVSCCIPGCAWSYAYVDSRGIILTGHGANSHRI